MIEIIFVVKSVKPKVFVPFLIKELSWRKSLKFKVNSLLTTLSKFLRKCNANSFIKNKLENIPKSTSVLTRLIFATKDVLTVAPIVWKNIIIEDLIILFNTEIKTGPYT